MTTRERNEIAVLFQHFRELCTTLLVILFSGDDGSVSRVWPIMKNAVTLEPAEENSFVFLPFSFSSSSLYISLLIISK